MGGREPIRWAYPIVGGLIAEGVTIAFIALVVALTGHGGGGAPGAPIDPVANTIGAVMAATVGSLLCYVMGWWAARQAGSRFRLHGALVGIASAVLTVLALAFGPPGRATSYVVALVMKVVAGSAGGSMAEKMAAGH